MSDKDNVDELAEALAASSLAASSLASSSLTSSSLASSSLASSSQQKEQEHRPTTLDDVPNDVLVSIFEFDEVRDRRWAVETFPLVCKAWRDVYYSRQASPLHKEIFLSLQTDRASPVLAWARRHAADVRTLFIEPCNVVRDFSEEDLAELVSVVGPHLTALSIQEGCGSLLRARFWAALEDAVRPGRRLKGLAIEGIRTPLPGSCAEVLGRCSGLEGLLLSCEADWSGGASSRSVAARNRGSWGFSAFPRALLSLPRLDALILEHHPGVASLPAGISELKSLQYISIVGCPLRSLPAEMGALSGLTRLDVGFSSLGAVPTATAFPAALGGMTSLRELSLFGRSVSTVPSFVGSLKSLELLLLSGNILGRASAPHHGFPSSFPKMPALKTLHLHSCNLTAVPPAVLSSFPGLERLDLGNNSLRELPEDFGRRMQRLKSIDLRGNMFSAVPVAALAGAPALEIIWLTKNERLQVEEPLDALLENHPRLQWVRLWKESGSWTRNSRRHLAMFALKIGGRNPVAGMALLAEP